MGRRRKREKVLSTPQKSRERRAKRHEEKHQTRLSYRPSLLDKAIRAAQGEWVLLDYDNLPPDVFARVVEQAEDTAIVAIGHTKVAPNADNFARTMWALRRRVPDIKFGVFPR